MNRISWIDYMKGIAMFLVVLSHSEGLPTLVEYYFRPFFLTSFFFASGYLFHDPSKPFNIKKKAIKIIEGILIPYLIYWIISFIIDKLINGNSCITIIQELIQSLLRGQKLWFISCLLCSEIIMCTNLFISKNPIYILISGIISFSIWLFTNLSKPGEWIWCVNIAFLAYLYMSLGYCFRNYETRLSQYITNIKIGLSLSVIYIILICTDYLYLNNTVIFALNYFSNIGYFILCSSIALASLYFLYNKLKVNKIITFLSVNSLLIYFFHNQILNILKYFSKLNMFNILPEWSICLFQTVGTIILAYIPIMITNKYIPILSGKSKWLSNISYKYEK